MKTEITTEQLLAKIGALAVENDVLRAAVDRLQREAAALAEKKEPAEGAL